MNKIFYSLIVAIAMILTSCAGTYDIKGTSNVSVLDGKMLYLKQYHDSDLKNIDSCDVVHGQFGFNGRLDSVRMVTLFMDDENIMPDRKSVV